MSSLPVNLGSESRIGASEPEVCIIEARAAWWTPDLAAVARYRDLIWMLALRDLRVRYKQTLLGVGWAVIQPLATMVVLTAFFGKLLGMTDRVGDVPYPVFLYAGLLPWTLFSAGVYAAAQSLVANGHILSKVYFPRLVLPLSALISPIVDYGLAAVVLAGLMAWYGVAFGAQLALLPLSIALVLLATISVGLPLAAFTASYRDTRHALPFLLQTWFFVSPVIYPSTLVPPAFAWVARLNPMAGPLEVARAAIVGGPVDWLACVGSAAVSFVLLAIGLAWFARVEDKLSDVV